ncbi:hypothetical protein QUA20_02840 [Microcoleus sp. Pol7_A1]
METLQQVLELQQPESPHSLGKLIEWKLSGINPLVRWQWLPLPTR